MLQSGGFPAFIFYLSSHLHGPWIHQAEALQGHPDLLPRREGQTLQDRGNGLRQLPTELGGVA